MLAQTRRTRPAARRLLLRPLTRSALSSCPSTLVPFHVPTLHPLQIGRGAYGLVAAAEDVLTGFKVAIKRISRVFTDLIDAKRILREIKLLRHLGEHENVIDILDIMTGPPETEDFHTLYIVTVRAARCARFHAPVR